MSDDKRTRDRLRRTAEGAPPTKPAANADTDPQAAPGRYYERLDYGPVYMPPNNTDYSYTT